MNIILLGGPGSGKGTQAIALVKHFSLVHISTGQLFRQHMQQGTELGSLARSYIDKGELVPDAISVKMLRARLEQPDTRQGFILDGFPRTLPQAEALETITQDLDCPIHGVLSLEVPDDDIVTRLSGRQTCKECGAVFHPTYSPFEACPYQKCNGEFLYQREDDNPETIRERLQVFHHETAPLIAYYRNSGTLVSIDGTGDIETVTNRMLDAARGLLLG
ncbi:MAG TPA: adenylate kinase [Anaerolineales bacterium]|nr:adenylate kinase [Anaerolineales bacterium]